jgi:hypothetical protein
MPSSTRRVSVAGASRDSRVGNVHREATPVMLRHSQPGLPSHSVSATTDSSIAHFTRYPEYAPSARWYQSPDLSSSRQ